MTGPDGSARTYRHWMLRSSRSAPLVLAALTLTLVAGCDDDEPQEASSTQATADSTTTTTGQAAGIRQVHLKRCKVSSGGTDVMAAKVSCREVEDTISHWAPRSVFGSGTDRRGVFLEDGWQCWAELQKRYGPILNVCMRDNAVFTYLFH